MTRAIHLIVPAPFSAISGGYIYDRRMVEGLSALGQNVRVVELAGRHPFPDEAATEAARAVLAEVPEGACIVIDGLGLPAFLPLADELTRRSATALVHHPTALETGALEGQREALKAAERVLFSACARIITTSTLTARDLPEAFGADPARITVIEPGTDAAPRAVGSAGPGCAILSIGLLVPRKGHDVLLHALARLTDLEWSLAIAGDATRDPVHADGLRALAAELGLAQRVRFLGALPDAALDAEYARADLFALATRYEGYGMAAAEAMARGLPLAITAGGAIADIVPEDAAVVAAVDDHTALSRAMRRPIFDAGLRAAMAEASWRAGQALPRWPDRAAAFLKALDHG
ncbi:MAG: glycosyltransferase family 4 protein [Alphaproteobacteria bacterium]|nr:glycosyltransferase family 4 protein [Alphaproteobacteria bacterium]